MSLDNWVAQYYPRVKPNESEVKTESLPQRAAEAETEEDPQQVEEMKPPPVEEQKSAKSRKPRVTRRATQKGKK